MISQEEMKKLATLSRIDFTDSELESMARDMDSILGYVEQLNEIEGKQDRLSASATERTNVMREDEVTSPAGKYTEKILDSAPKTNDNFIEVKKILNN